MKHYFIIGIILILVMPACKSHKHVVGTKDVQTDITIVKDSCMTSSVSSHDWLTQFIVADSIGLRLTADSIVTPSGGTLYNPRIDFGAMRPTIGKEQHSERTENSLTEQRDSIRHSASVTESHEEDKGTVAVVEPIEKSDWRWAIVFVCVFLALLLLFRKKIKNIFSHILDY